MVNEKKNLIANELKIMCKQNNTNIIIQKYCKASRATYQNICLEKVTEKPWSVMSLDAEGRQQHNTPWLFCRQWENIKIF